MQKALDLAFGLDAGMVHLNDCTVSDEPHVPFGGVKNSGYGREGCRFSMEEMTELKWITAQRGQRAFPIRVFGRRPDHGHAAKDGVAVVERAVAMFGR